MPACEDDEAHVPGRSDVRLLWGFPLMASARDLWVAGICGGLIGMAVGMFVGWAYG